MAVSKNVYELAQERLELIFKEFDNIYVSFSGGKDSSVLLNLCIDYIRRHGLDRKIGVFHMDYEIQYTVTIDYVDRILEANKDILEVYRVCVPFKVTTCTSMYQSYWRPWDESMSFGCVRCRRVLIRKKRSLSIRRKCGITNSRCTLPNGCISGKMRCAPVSLLVSARRKASTAGAVFI